MPQDTIPKYPVTPTDGSAHAKAEAKGEKFDRFHPEMPSIPGVPNTPAPSPVKQDRVDPEQAARILRTLGIVAAVLVVAVGLLWWIKRASRNSVQPSSDDSAVESSAPDIPVDAPIPQPHEGPTVAATVEELSKPWSSKKFTFVNPLSQESVDAMVVRLPGGSLWAFSLQAPDGRCALEFIKDVGQISQKYRYDASHPMVVNPCSGTVFDPLKVGPLGGSTWARGEIVHGNGLRPPISIDVQVRGRSIIADSIE